MGLMIDRSTRVRAADFETAWFKSRAQELGQETGRYHRKIWEYAVIAQVYRERIWQKSEYPPNVLGFGCGNEPLPSWFYDLGAIITATDGPADPAWTKTGQHASRKGSYFEVDMNAIPAELLQGQFDFTWSCGSFEHIGGIDHSLRFFCNQMRCLKPGGIACHTTELNIDLDAGPTLNVANLCLLRASDLAQLAGMLWSQGDTLWLPDLQRGETEIDLFVDRPPYTANYHLNIEVGGFVTTSVVLIATKG